MFVASSPVSTMALTMLFQWVWPPLGDDIARSDFGGNISMNRAYDSLQTSRLGYGRREETSRSRASVHDYKHIDLNL